MATKLKENIALTGFVIGAVLIIVVIINIVTIIDKRYSASIKERQKTDRFQEEDSSGSPFWIYRDTKTGRGYITSTRHVIEMNDEPLAKKE